jgi:hypothetical protein
MKKQLLNKEEEGKHTQLLFIELVRVIHTKRRQVHQVTISSDLTLELQHSVRVKCKRNSKYEPNIQNPKS